MRINAIGIRLNYSSIWADKSIPGRMYNINLLNQNLIKNYINSFFKNNLLNKNILLSDIKIKNVSGIVDIYSYIYLFKYKNIAQDILKKRKGFNNRRNKISYKSFNAITLKVRKNYILFFLKKFFFENYLKKIKYIMDRDLSFFLKKKINFKFVLIKNKFFSAKLASDYIVSRLNNKFKLSNAINLIKKDIIVSKQYKGLIIYCSGRFDRKERASSNIFSFGKISLSTFKNKISYNQNNAILKYGVCGIKVWLLKK